MAEPTRRLSTAWGLTMYWSECLVSWSTEPKAMARASVRLSSLSSTGPSASSARQSPPP